MFKKNRSLVQKYAVVLMILCLFGISIKESVETTQIKSTELEEFFSFIEEELTPVSASADNLKQESEYIDQL